ncbi:Major facilitator superfamily MFS_1 (fragment) [Blastococcus saxobsidens DD2]|uniref:Major facilitator superfamily MFS_1 n=1 Tax=Blastococcus saxobsidens (strain DD2) TaxID=1146883 RepID=H6RQY8_BLASD
MRSAWTALAGVAAVGPGVGGLLADALGVRAVCLQAA